MRVYRARLMKERAMCEDELEIPCESGTLVARKICDEGGDGIDILLRRVDGTSIRLAYIVSDDDGIRGKMRIPETIRSFSAPKHVKELVRELAIDQMVA